MRISQLHAFLAVAEELSFRRAAARIFLSPPALSAQIRQLEHDLGVRLFERDRRGTHLSADGLALLPVARHALSAVAQVELAARRGRPPRTRLVCGVLAMGVGDLTWPLLRTFHEARSDVELTVVQVGFFDALPSLESGSCDVLLTVGPIGDARVHAETVGSMPVDAMLPLGHPMAEAPAVPLAWFGENVTIRPPVSMSSDWVDYWSLHDYGGHPEFEFDPSVDAGVPKLIEAVARVRVLGPWPRGAGLSPAVAIRPLDTPVEAPLQIVTRYQATAEVKEFTELGRRLSSIS